MLRDRPGGRRESADALDGPHCCERDLVFQVSQNIGSHRTFGVNEWGVSIVVGVSQEMDGLVQRKSHEKKWMMTGGTTILGNLQLVICSFFHAEI